VALLADSVLSRLGDDTATQRIAAAVSSPENVGNVGKTAEVEAVTRSGQAALAPLLVPLLKHRDSYTRTAAAEGLAALGYKGALDDMRLLLSDPYVEVRSKAAVALARLGDSAGRDVIGTMLRSPVPDVRLKAVEADASISAAQRASVINAVLIDAEPMNRVRAAELVARDNPDAARPTLVALLKDPDSMPRREAARVLETMTPVDLELSRIMMVDIEPWVRMYAAGAVLKAGR
jgi:HEAT repeat protein